MTHLSKKSLRKLAATVRETGTSDGFVPEAPRRNDNEEWRIQCSIIAWWDVACKGWGLMPQHLFSIPNGSVLGSSYQTRVIRAKMLKSAGLRPGVPDLFLSVAHVKFFSDWDRVAGLYIEVKTPTGVVAPEQTQFHEILRRSHYRVEVCRSLDAAVRYITEYLS